MVRPNVLKGFCICVSPWKTTTFRIASWRVSRLKPSHPDLHAVFCIGVLLLCSDFDISLCAAWVACVAGLYPAATCWSVQSEKAAVQQPEEQIHLALRGRPPCAQPAIHVQPSAQVSTHSNAA